MIVNITMTNEEYCRTLTREDLWLVVKVAERFIQKECGLDAPRWVKEAAFDKWYKDIYDPDEWYRAKQKPKVPSSDIRVGCVHNALHIRSSHI